MDDLLAFYSRFQIKNNNLNKSDKPRQLELFVKAFAKNKHDIFYPIAFRPLDETLQYIGGLISNLLTPPVEHINRFGFKNITVNSINTFHIIKKLFANSFLIFMFRNPLQQWVSVRESVFFPYSNNISLFLDIYTKMAQKYLSYYKENEEVIFIENTFLYDRPNLQILFSTLEITDFDQNLFKDKISSYEGKNISDIEKNKIENSKAYENYQNMKEIYNKQFNISIL